MTPLPLATITPRPEAHRCEADSCDETGGLAKVDPEDSSQESRTLCGDCRLVYYEELRSA